MNHKSVKAMNEALRRIENDTVQITCPVSDIILIIAGLRIAITNPRITPFASAERMGDIADKLTAVVVLSEPALEAMFTDGDLFQ